MATVPALDAFVPGMMPGRYLTLRREAAGLSIDQVTAKFTLSPNAADVFSALLVEAEADRCTLPSEVLVSLARKFQIDAYVYRCLVSWIPAGRICEGCGCTWNDACWTEEGPCTWSSTVTADFDVCTACAGTLGQ